MAEEQLAKELKTFERHQNELESESMGCFVVINGDDIIGTYSNFDDAAKDAIQRFGAETTYLIRKIGNYSATLSIAALLGRTGANPFDQSAK